MEDLLLNKVGAEKDIEEPKPKKKVKFNLDQGDDEWEDVNDADENGDEEEIEVDYYKNLY